MSKFLVKMLGAWMLQDNLSEGKSQVVQAHRPSVVEDSDFLRSREKSQVVFLAPLKDEATDEGFEKVFEAKNRDVAAAVEAFLKDFGIKAEPAETAEQKAAREAKEAAALQTAVTNGLANDPKGDSKPEAAKEVKADPKGDTKAPAPAAAPKAPAAVETKS